MKIGISNWARPFASAWRVLAFTLVVCATGGAWAATPVAEWTDFRNLTSGNYTWTADASCSVDANGVLTIGSNGGLYMEDASAFGFSNNHDFTLAIEADVPSYSSNTAIADLTVNNAHVSIEANGTTIYQYWNGAGDYGNGTIGTGRQLITLAFQGGGTGTTTYINGSSVADKSGLTSSNGKTTKVCVGCYNGSSRAANGMKIYSIRLYSTKLDATNVSTDKTLFYPDANRYLTLSGGTTQWSEASWTSATPGANDCAKVNVTDDSTLNLDDSATAVKMSDFYVAAGKTLTLTGDMTKAGKAKFTGPGKVANWNTINLNIAADSNSLTTSEKVGMPGVGVTGTLWDNLNVSSGNHTSGSFNFGKVVDASSANSLDYRFGVAYSGTRGAWYTNLGSSDNLRYGYLDDQNASGKNTPTISLFGVPFDKYRVVVYHSTDSENYQFGYDTVNGDDLYYDSNLVLQSGTTAWGSSGPNNSAHPIAEGTNTLVSGVYTAPTLTVVGHRPSSGNVRGCIAAVQVVKVEEVTISTVDTYTLAGLFGSVGVNSDFIINVNEDATLNIPASTTLGAIEFNVASGKTLTLTGNTLTASRCITVKGSGMVATSVMNVLAGTIKGNGTLCYDMNDGITKPTGLTCTKAAWTGVLWIKNSDYTGWLFKDYGSTASTVRIENVTCYLNGSETLNSTLDLVGEGLKITNGNGYTVETVKKLTGSGTLTLSGGSANGNGFVIQDASEFYGTIQNTSPAGGSRRYKVTIGGSGTYGYDRNMVIANGYTGTIANGKTWTMPGGFEVSGTLAFAGTGTASGPVTTFSGSTLDLSGFTGTAPAISGTLTLASGTTIKLPSGATLPYQIASSGDGLVGNVTVEIDGGATTTSAVKLANGTISLAKSATISGTMAQEVFSNISWTGSGNTYLLTLSATATLLTFDDVSDVEELKIVVENDGLLYVAGELPANLSVDGLASLTVAEDSTLGLAADYTRLYSQIGTTTTGNDALSSSGTTISVSYALASSALPAGNYTIARWLTPQKLSTGYGHVASVTATVGTETDGVTPLTKELVYMADRIVLRVYDATAQAARGTIKIWPYGDSITEGYNANHSGQNYRVLLYQKLALLGYNVQSVGCYNLDDGTESEDPSGQELPATWKWHSAKHGATAGRSDSTASSRGNLEENVDTLCAQAGNPDVVLLHIGINDIVSSDRNPTTVYASISNVISRLESNLPNSIIVVSTVLDVATAAQTGRQINGVYLPTLVDQLNEKIRNGIGAFTSGRVVLADLNDYVKSADDGIIYDGVHPDWWGYDQMAEGWLAAITDNFTADDIFNDAMLPPVASSSLGAAAKAELADYRKGFKRYAVLEADKNILPTLETTIPYTDVNSDAASANLSKVAYFVEYVRADNNAHKWVWVDMDAFGTTIGDVGLPVAKHQQVVRHLHVKSNHGAIDDVAADSEGVTGFIEFSPFGYSGASGSDSGPKDYSSRYDWNDTLVDGNTYACMQVHRIISTSAEPGGQVLFAFNNWRDSSTEAEFGIGNFSQHFSRGNQTFDYTDTKAISTMNAAAYAVKRIEIWTKPTSEYQSNDLKGSTHADATFPNSERWKITIPGDSGSVKINTIVLGSRSDKNPVPADNLRIQIATAQGTVATSDVMNGDGVPQGDATFADGGYKQTFSFGEDCVLARGTSYELKIVDSDGAYASWPSMLENYDTGDAYSVISNTVNVVNNWRASQAVSASKVYAASMSANIDAFGSLSFSPSLPTDTADRANADLLVNVTADATLTIGDAMPTVGSIRFNISDDVTLTLADPANINAGEVVVYGPGTLAFDDSATFKAGTDLEFAGAAKVALASGQVLTTTGDIVVGSSATLTVAPATITGLSASLVSAASINGEIALTAPDENSDYSLTVSATGVTLHRTSQAKFTYNPVPGENTPSGWITSWGGEPLATTSLRVGPSSAVPYVYHTATNKHPWVNLAARTSGFSYAIYADVSQMESDKGVITAFGNTGKGLFLYREGNYVKLAHVVGTITTPDWVPGVAISAGYHLYTVTFDPTTGAAALYLDDGSTCAATDGSTHPHLGTQGLNNGFQLGSVFEGVGDSGFHLGVGMAVCAVRGYDVVLQHEEVETISQSFPATDGNVTWNVEPDNADNTVIVTSATFGDSNYIGQSKGTLTIPAGSEVNVKHIRVLNNNSTSDRATVNIAGTLNITSESTNPNVWADGTSKGVLFGHYHGQATYNITGSLLAENTYIEMVYTAEAQLLDISGGTVKTKALYANNGNSTVKLRDGGTLEVAEILSTGSAITKEFKYGTFRVTADATETRAINFSAAGGYATTLDPHGNRLTLESAALTGSGDITVADSSDDGDGTVVFVGGSSYTGRLILTDANAANIDISGYTGTVLYQGTESETLELLDGFAGTVYFTDDIDATGIDLSRATVHIADNCTFTADAGKEGSLVLGSGATVTLNVDDNTVKYEGYVPTVSGSGTVGYYNTTTSAAVSGADYVNGNNLLPYYNVWSASATASENTLSANASARWKSDNGSSGVLPADNKNVAFKLENGNTVTLLVDATKTFNDIQVFGNGTLIIQKADENVDTVMTVGKGLYTTANTTVQIDSGLAFDSGAKLDVDSAIPMHYVVVNCGSAESPFSIPAITGSGMLSVAAGKALTTASSSGSMLNVDGTVTFTGAGSTGAIYVTATGTANVNASITATTFSVYAGGVVNVAAGVTLTAPTLTVNGTVNMTSTSSFSGLTTLSGAGSVTWTGKQPDGTIWKDAAAWTGTNIVMSTGTTVITNLTPENWGRNGSYIVMKNLKGYIDTNNATVQAKVVFENGDNGYALAISDGYGGRRSYFREIAGNGTIKDVGEKTDGGGAQLFVFKTASEFTGSIINLGTEGKNFTKIFVFSADSTNTDGSTYGRIIIESDGQAVIGDGKAWNTQYGAIVGGTVTLQGAATMAKVTFNNGATLKLSGDTAKYLTTTGTLTWPSSGTVTIDAFACGSSTVKIPVFAADAANANFSMSTVAFTPPNGSTVVRWTTYVEQVGGKYVHGISKVGTIFSVW